jgi:hypothetical protein
MRSVARKKFKGMEYARFNYMMGAGENRREFFGVFRVNDGHCFPFENGKIVKGRGARSPNLFLKARHPGTTESGNRRGYSAPGIINMKGMTLVEWRELGDSISILFESFDSIMIPVV